MEHETFNEIFALLIQGVIDVIKKQMDDYLIGELATLSPSKCYQSKSAPVHNMFAEQHEVKMTFCSILASLNLLRY